VRAFFIVLLLEKLRLLLELLRRRSTK